MYANIPTWANASLAHKPSTLIGTHMPDGRVMTRDVYRHGLLANAALARQEAQKCSSAIARARMLDAARSYIADARALRLAGGTK